MQIINAMTPNIHVVNPGQSIAEAAQMMAECDCGVLPVAENDQLVGMITDRDIVVRAIAKEMDSDTQVGDVMSPEIKYCFQEDEISDVARNMAELQIRRLPVVNQDKRLVGIISLGDIANAESGPAAEALSGISRHDSQQSGNSAQQPH